MIEDEKIIELFFERSEQSIRELDTKYGKVCRKLCHIHLGVGIDGERDESHLC